MVWKLTALAVLGTGLWFASAAPAAAQQGEFNAPDLVLINGKVLTLDEQSTVTEAIAVREGKILATGSSASIKSLAGARTRVLDVSGKTVVPGLIDTHAHFKAAGLADYVVNMSRAKMVAEALEAIKAFAARRKPGEWIVGGAWHPPSQLAKALGAGLQMKQNDAFPLAVDQVERHLYRAARPMGKILPLHLRFSNSIQTGTSYPNLQYLPFERQRDRYAHQPNGERA